MDTKKRDGDPRDKRFQREELKELLRLFSSLGITVCVGIVGFFLLGLYGERTLAEMGWNAHGAVRIAGVLLGVGMSFYWAYLRIVSHLRKFEREDPPTRRSPEGDERLRPKR